MGSSNGTAKQDVSPHEFKDTFPTTHKLIQKEWPGIEDSALDATGGDLEKVAELIAASAQHASGTVKKHLAELHHLATDAAAPEPNPSAGTEAKLTRLDAVLKRLESRTGEIAEKLQGDVLPLAERAAKKNIWVTILTALGVGMILGLVLRLGARRGG